MEHYCSVLERKVRLIMKDELIRCRDCAFCTLVQDDYGKSEHCNLQQLNATYYATYCNLLKAYTDEDGFCSMYEETKENWPRGYILNI